MEKIRNHVLECQKCELYKSKKKYVFGEGNESARIMFIGEAPGHNEDVLGRPFVGRAGNILNEMLGSVNMDRGDIYLSNVLKCRPPNNRNPTTNEINACSPYLREQISFLNPHTIVTLGNYATDFVLGLFNIKNKEGISAIHGKVFNVSTLSGIIRIVPMYHPAVATYNPDMKKTLLKDMKVLLK